MFGFCRADYYEARHFVFYIYSLCTSRQWGCWMCCHFFALSDGQAKLTAVQTKYNRGAHFCRLKQLKRCHVNLNKCYIVDLYTWSLLIYFIPSFSQQRKSLLRHSVAVQTMLRGHWITSLMVSHSNMEQLTLTKKAIDVCRAVLGSLNLKL